MILSQVFNNKLFFFPFLALRCHFFNEEDILQGCSFKKRLMVHSPLLREWRRQVSRTAAEVREYILFLILSRWNWISFLTTHRPPALSRNPVLPLNFHPAVPGIGRYIEMCCWRWRRQMAERRPGEWQKTRAAR